MAAIAEAESSGNSIAYNASGATGLWQILGAVNPGDQSSLTTPSVNAHEALLKLESQGLDAWTTYTSGAYLQFMNGAGPTSTATAGSTSGSGVGPMSFTESVIPGAGWIGSLITGVTGGETGLASIADVATGVAGIVRSLNKMIELSIVLMEPKFWLRIGAGFAGVVFFLVSMYFMNEAL
jgi:hypothetical protein